MAPDKRLCMSLVTAVTTAVSLAYPRGNFTLVIEELMLFCIFISLSWVAANVRYTLSLVILSYCNILLKCWLAARNSAHACKNRNFKLVSTACKWWVQSLFLVNVEPWAVCAVYITNPCQPSNKILSAPFLWAAHLVPASFVDLTHWHL